MFSFTHPLHRMQSETLSVGASSSNVNFGQPGLGAGFSFGGPAGRSQGAGFSLGGPAGASPSSSSVGQSGARPQGAGLSFGGPAASNASFGQPGFSLGGAAGSSPSNASFGQPGARPAGLPLGGPSSNLGFRLGGGVPSATQPTTSSLALGGAGNSAGVSSQTAMGNGGPALGEPRAKGDIGLGGSGVGFGFGGKATPSSGDAGFGSRGSGAAGFGQPGNARVNTPSTRPPNGPQFGGSLGNTSGAAVPLFGASRPTGAASTASVNTPALLSFGKTSGSNRVVSENLGPGFSRVVSPSRAGDVEARFRLEQSEGLPTSASPEELFRKDAIDGKKKNTVKELS